MPILRLLDVFATAYVSYLMYNKYGGAEAFITWEVLSTLNFTYYLVKEMHGQIKRVKE